MRLFVVSDLHILGVDDPLYIPLVSLLKEKAQAGDTVVLAGDLFDLFVGNKRVFRERYASFLEAVRGAGERGVRIHYIEGNHDFLIRPVFTGVQGLTIHSHDVSVEIGGRRFYFGHGDTVDRSDYPYRVLRFFFRSPLMKALVYALPGKWIDRIGKSSSSYSRQKKPLLPKDLPIARMERLRCAYRSFAAEKLAHGYDFVVLGHSHDLDEMTFQVGGKAGQYINVGYPRAHGSILIWTPEDEKISREPFQ